MRISRIRLLGFKSFAAKTELEIDPGITAIVGPNGCGKSNVIDAVKWVLGEQNPSSLRAKEMMDVIFSGSDHKKPLGMAEVTLVFDNSDGALGMDRAEVVLTRRLYRSGESEYLLNGAPCRLKDLRETLMDTGSGLDAFSIMEQGRIDAILTANPEERRIVFEEAAGIGRYKARRKETIRRLEKVGDDLTRLKDVIEITEKQLRSLRYQASRASRYREFTEELRKKRVTWALCRYHTLLIEKNAIGEGLSSVAEEEGRINRELRSLVEDLSGKETSFEEFGRQLREAETALLGLDSEIRSARERAEHGRRLSSELSDRVKWCDGEIEVTTRRLKDLSVERSEVEGEQTALSAEVAVREAELVAAEEAIRTLRAGEKAHLGELEELRRDRVRLRARQTELGNERARLESEIRSGEALEERLSRRRNALETEREALVAEQAEACGGFDALEEREWDLRGRLRVSEEEGSDLAKKERDLSGQASECEQRLASARSRLDLLVSMRARHEGMDRPVQCVLEQGAAGRLSGVRGVIADLIRVDGADADSVELLLGACAQGIVTETMGDALLAIDYLKANNLGRALFLPLDQVREAGPVYAGNGVARQALGSVRVVDDYRPLVRALLSESILVEDVDRARSLSAETGRSLRIVTGGGEVFNRIGTVAGGRGKAKAVLLSRNAEIDRLGVEASEETERRDALAEALARVRASRQELGVVIRGLREARETASREVAEVSGRLARLARDLGRLDDEEKVLGVERGEIEGARATAAARVAALCAEEAEVSARAEKIGAALDRVEAALAGARERSREGDELRLEVRVELARARERLTGAEGRLAGLARSLDEGGGKLEATRAERASCESRCEEAALGAEVAQKQAADGAKKREALLAEVADRRSRHDAVRETLLSSRKDAEALRESHERYRTSLEEFRLRESEIRTRLEGLLERVSEEFEIDLPDLYEGFTPEGMDWEALDREVTDLKDKIDRMGNVNLEAIDQLREVDERVRFLQQEEGDLVKSREQLSEILRKVNRESRERFETAFASIRENFREMFRKLFGGGKADIMLDEGQDVLEAGIDIVARPPGREQRNLNLLSGGEKTLTAVALMIAIFKSRPSPFALMDEVDAALDESNIDRFLKVLREFTDKSQFLIITHNKRTMADADALYGVSMPEAGVSQPVSVRFRAGGGTAEEPVTEGAVAG